MSDAVKTKMDETDQDPLSRLRRAAARLARLGSPLGGYFLGIGDGSIASQRDTKDQLPQRLRASTVAPQVVTVQGRGGQKAAAYLIIPIERAAEVLEAQVPEESFVPITASLREIGGEVDLPVLVPSRSSGRRLRSAPRSLTSLVPSD